MIKKKGMPGDDNFDIPDDEVDEFGDDDDGEEDDLLDDEEFDEEFDEEDEEEFSTSSTRRPTTRTRTSTKSTTKKSPTTSGDRPTGCASPAKRRPPSAAHPGRVMRPILRPDSAPFDEGSARSFGQSLFVFSAR